MTSAFFCFLYLQGRLKNYPNRFVAVVAVFLLVPVSQYENGFARSRDSAKC